MSADEIRVTVVVKPDPKEEYLQDKEQIAAFIEQALLAKKIFDFVDAWWIEQ